MMLPKSQPNFGNCQAKLCFDMTAGDAPPQGHERVSEVISVERVPITLEVNEDRGETRPKSPGDKVVAKAR
jgi:hypothetical protein